MHRVGGTGATLALVEGLGKAEASTFYSVPEPRT